MLRRGFTLAEVLITLTIIGVVATLTTPALVKNVGSSKIGPQLAKFVNTWETGVGTMMMEENINTFRDLGISDLKCLELLSKYIIMSKLSESYSVADSKGKLIQTLPSLGLFWQLKDGTLIYEFFISGYEPKGVYKGPAFSLMVDIGGIKGPHRAGKEVFMFLVDQSGILIPYGSNAHKALDSSVANISCNHNGSITQQWACTGAVADNGYKAPW